MKKEIPAGMKKEISRLRSEVRQLKSGVDLKKESNPFTGATFGSYWSATGLPWTSSDGRKAVLTEI